MTYISDFYKANREALKKDGVRVQAYLSAQAEMKAWTRLQECSEIVGQLVERIDELETAVRTAMEQLREIERKL